MLSVSLGFAWIRSGANIGRRVYRVRVVHRANLRVLGLNCVRVCLLRRASRELGYACVNSGAPRRRRFHYRLRGFNVAR